MGNENPRENPQERGQECGWEFQWRSISQVKAFKEETDVTGLVLTKMDGTAKGGVVLGIVEENKIPVKFIGVGEQMEDMEIFNSEEFVKAII